MNFFSCKMSAIFGEKLNLLRISCIFCFLKAFNDFSRPEAVTHSLILFPCSEIDECLSSPCQNGGTCTDLHAGFECACIPGYSGSECQTSKYIGLYSNRITYENCVLSIFDSVIMHEHPIFQVLEAGVLILIKNCVKFSPR